MMAMFGWTDPKMPAHYIAKAKRDKLGPSGMEKLMSFDSSQNENVDDFMPLPKRWWNFPMKSGNWKTRSAMHW